MLCDLSWSLCLSYEACSHKNILNHLQILLVRNTTNLLWMRKEAMQQNISYSKAGDFLWRVLSHIPLNWNTETCYHETERPNSDCWNAWKNQLSVQCLRCQTLPHHSSPPVLPSRFPLSEVNMREKRKRRCYTYLIVLIKRKQIKQIRKDEIVY